MHKRARARRARSCILHASHYIFVTQLRYVKVLTHNNITLYELCNEMLRVSQYRRKNLKNQIFSLNLISSAYANRRLTQELAW